MSVKKRGLPGGAGIALHTLDEIAQSAQGRATAHLALTRVRFDEQPRQIIPPERFAALAQAGQATPAAVLAALQELAVTGEPWATVLADLQELAQTIRPPGRVRQPILYYEENGVCVVLDGHRRCLGSLLAGRDTVPAIAVVGETAWERAVDRLVIERGHADWTGFERAAGLVDAWRRLQEAFAGRHESELPGLTVADLAEISAGDAEDGAAETGGEARDGILTGRRLKGATRQVILRHTGMSKAAFYHQVNLVTRLGPAAQAIAQQARLAERQIRPVIVLSESPPVQAACLQAIADYGLPGDRGELLVQAVLETGVDPQTEARRLAGCAAGPSRRVDPARSQRTATEQPTPPAPLRPPAQAPWRKTHRAVVTAQSIVDVDAIRRAAPELADAERLAVAENLKQLQALVSRALAALRVP